MSEWKTTSTKPQLLHSHSVCWAYWVSEADSFHAAFALVFAHPSSSAREAAGQAAHCKSSPSSLVQLSFEEQLDIIHTQDSM